MVMTMMMTLSAMTIMSDRGFCFVTEMGQVYTCSPQRSFLVLRILSEAKWDVNTIKMCMGHAANEKLCGGNELTTLWICK